MWILQCAFINIEIDLIPKRWGPSSHQHTLCNICHTQRLVIFMHVCYKTITKTQCITKVYFYFMYCVLKVLRNWSAICSLHRFLSEHKGMQHLWNVSSVFTSLALFGSALWRWGLQQTLWLVVSQHFHCNIGQPGRVFKYSKSKHVNYCRNCTK